MTFDHLANLFYNWGWEVKPQHYQGFKSYLLEMMRRKRVMIVFKGELIDAVITYFLTNDYTKIYKKGEWDIPNDEPHGSQIYVDKMICRRWTPTLRRYVQEMIETTFPNVLEGYYLRAPYDRCVIIYRKETANV